MATFATGEVFGGSIPTTTMAASVTRRPRRRMSRSLGISTLAAVAFSLSCGLLVSSYGYLAAVVAGAPLLVLAITWVVWQMGSTAGRVRAAATFLVLIAVAVPWQDTATLGTVSISNSTEKYKLAITVFAFLIAASCRLKGQRRSIITWLLISYVAVSAIGGMAGPDPQSSLLRSARLLAFILAVGWAVERFDPRDLSNLFAKFAFWLSALSLGAYMMGLSPMFHGRLGGYPFKLHPNLLGYCAGLGLLCLVMLWTDGQRSGAQLAYTAPVLVATLGLTQSRTSLGVFRVGLVVRLAARPRARAASVLWLTALALIIAAMVQTNTTYQPLGHLLTHGGKSPLASALDSRFAEMKAAVATNDTYTTKLLGRGLAAKSVRVDLPFAQYAPVDNSWYAAYYSAGVLGVLLLALAVISSFFIAAKARSVIALAILTFILFSSFTETVLADVNVGLVLLVALVASMNAQTLRDKVLARSQRGLVR